MATTTMGERIRARREELGMNQAELARKLGIKQPSLWAIENDETKTLKGATLQALCEHLRTTSDHILDGGEHPGGLQLATMEAELLYAIRALPAEKRVALIQYARWLLSQEDRTDLRRRSSDTPAKVTQFQPRKKTP